MITLSLCMATLNRALIIGDTLDSILCQLEDGVELVILDGGSTDKTREVVDAKIKNKADVRYIREPTNSGIDADFDKAISHARGHFCWLLADDDLLKPGAVAKVLAACRRGFGLIIVNAEVRSADLRLELKARRLPLKTDRVYTEGEADSFFVDTIDHLSFIGAAVVPRGVWMQRDRRAYYGTEFIHVGVIFQAPIRGLTLVIAEPQITIRYGNAHWTGRAFEIWMNKWPRLLWSFSAVSERSKSAVLAREPWRKGKHLVLYRATGSYGREAYRRFVRPSASGFSRFWPSLISVLPGIPTNLACVIYVQLLAPNAKGTLLDLYASPYWVGHWVQKR